MSSPPEAHQEMEPDRETSNVEQTTNSKPRWIPVEELADYYAKHKPIGRKYPALSQSDFDNLYVDDTLPEVQASELEARDKKKAAKSTRRPLVKSTATSRSNDEAKEDSVVQSTTSKPIRESGKSNMSKEKYSEDEEEEEEDEEDEEGEEEEGIEEDEKREEPQVNSTGVKYKSCDNCTWARVKCVAGQNTNTDGDKICLECEKRGRTCHFSIKGQRPATQP
jgi:hypothetical protein